MSDTTTSVVTHAVSGYYYNRSMLKAARPLLLHTNWAQVKDIPRNNTNVVKFRRYELLTANTTPLSEGVTPSGTALSITDVSATCLQYGDYITVTDVLSFTTMDPVLSEAADILGQQAGNSLDQVCRDVMVAGTTIQYASTASSRETVSASMKITRDEIKEAVRTLKNNNAAKMTRMINPSTGFNTTALNACYIGICSPSTTFDLKEVAGWTPVEEYASQAGVMEGEVGKVDEVRFVETSNAKVFSASGAGSIDVHGTLILAQNYYGITRISGEAMKNIVKSFRDGGTADPLEQRSTSGWKAMFVAERLNENFCVRLEHAVSA